MRLLFAAAAFAATAVPAYAEESTYAAIYYTGTDQITLNAQPTPIPVPAVGSAIEVSDQGKRITGYVTGVAYDFRREGTLVPFRHYLMKVEISPTPTGYTGARGFRR